MQNSKVCIFKPKNTQNFFKSPPKVGCALAHNSPFLCIFRSTNTHSSSFMSYFSFISFSLINFASTQLLIYTMIQLLTSEFSEHFFAITTFPFFNSKPEPDFPSWPPFGFQILYFVNLEFYRTNSSLFKLRIGCMVSCLIVVGSLYCSYP
jgi:hypothetical protein